MSGAPSTEAAPPATVYVFGAHGDLTRRLLVPAFYRLACAGLLAPSFRMVGVDHNAGSSARFRGMLQRFMRQLARDPCAEAGGEPLDPTRWSKFAAHIEYLQGDFLADETYAAIAADLQGHDTPNAIFYLATPPRFVDAIVRQLGIHRLLVQPPKGFRRLVLEKPFGTDWGTARQLNARLRKITDESHIYRIDHFRGKEAVRGILALRFGVSWLEAFWNRHYIEQVQISAVETLGVESRGKFYEATGALRDMVPNHLFQLLAMIAMEPPVDYSADGVRNETGKVLTAIRRYSPAQARRFSVRGQYAAAHHGRERLAAYRDEPQVAPDSHTETFVALKLFVDTWRWSGVPFYIRTGKRMHTRCTEIALGLRPAPAGSAPPFLPRETSWLTLRIDPDADVTIDIQGKLPGPALLGAPATLRLVPGDVTQHPGATGYESLLYGCLTGTQTLFQRADAIEAAWRAVRPFQLAWQRDDTLLFYPAGSDGPAAAHRLLAQDGYHWHAS